MENDTLSCLYYSDNSDEITVRQTVMLIYVCTLNSCSSARVTCKWSAFTYYVRIMYFFVSLQLNNNM